MKKIRGAMILRGIDEIPTGEECFLVQIIPLIWKRAFMGSPTKVIVYTLEKEAEDYNEAFKYFASHKVNYLVVLLILPPLRLLRWLHGLRVFVKRVS